MTRLSLLFPLVLSWVFSYAQRPIVIKFDKEFPIDQNVVFYTYHKTHPIVSSVFTRSNDSIVLQGPEEAGQCMLTFEGAMTMADFIYNPKENITIELKAEMLYQGQLIIKKSKDNVCYQDLLKINNAYNRVLDSLIQARINMAVSMEGYKLKCAHIDSLYDKIAREKNARLTTLQFYYPSTYTAQTLVPFHIIPVDNEGTHETPYAYQAKNYFRYLRPNVRMLMHPSMYEFINTYFTKHITNDDAGIKKAIINVLDAFSTDTAVFNEVRRFLIQSFSDQLLYKYVWYTMAHTAKQCPVDWVDAGQDFTANQKHASRGSVVDDIVLKDINEKPVSLYNIISKSKKANTLLLFWSGGCEKNESGFQQLMQGLLKEKTTVFAVYLGSDRKEWEALVKKYGLQKFVNVSELEPIEKSRLVHRFMVTAVPKTYILTRDKKIK